QLVQNNTSTNNTRIYLAGGITLPNDIVIAQPNPYSNANTSFGVLQYLAGSTGNVTLTGAITQQANAFSGTTFQGPATTSTDVLNVNGPVFTTGTANTISAVGNVGFGGGGSYPNLSVVNGKAIVNA